MPVATQYWKVVLPAERSDPEIVDGDRLSNSFEFKTNRRVVVSARLRNVEYVAILHHIVEPFPVLAGVPGLRDPVAILANHHHREHQALGSSQDDGDLGMFLGGGGERVRVKY